MQGNAKSKNLRKSLSDMLQSFSKPNSLSLECLACLAFLHIPVRQAGLSCEERIPKQDNS